MKVTAEIVGTGSAEAWVTSTVPSDIEAVQIVAASIPTRVPVVRMDDYLSARRTPLDYRDQVNGPFTGRHAGANFEETVCVLVAVATHSPLRSLAQTRRASMHGWYPMSRGGLLGTPADNRPSWPPVGTRCY